jgi:hypothetical protein
MTRRRLIVAVAGLLVTILVPVIGGAIGYLSVLCFDVHGCNGLGVVSLGVFIAFLVGSFLGGYIN